MTITDDLTLTALLAASRAIQLATEATTSTIEHAKLRDIGIEVTRAVGRRAKVLRDAETSAVLS